GELALVALLFDTPFALDGAGRARPHLAVAIEAQDPLRVKLAIRPGLRFSDGTPLGAADVAASLNRARQSPAGWPLAPIRGARAVSDEVVELELSRPAPGLPSL